MKVVTISEARTHLSALVRAAEAGEHIVITRRMVSIARIIPAFESSANQQSTRLCVLDDKAENAHASKP